MFELLRTWLPLALSATALGVAILSRPTEVAPTAPPSLESAVADDARLEELAWTVANLTRRLERLERRGVPLSGDASPLPGPGATATEPEREGSSEDVAALEHALASEPGRAQLVEAVRTAQAEMFAERMQERMTSSDQANHERYQRFVEEARLSSRQDSALADAMTREREARAALLEQLRAGEREGPEVFRDLRALRHETDEAAREILDADQQAQYEAMRDDERRERRARWSPWR